MRLTFRAKLMAIVGLAALACGLFVFTGEIATRHVEGQLTAIRARYLPKVELEPELDGEFERLHRAYQDAVASSDLDGLGAARAARSRMLAHLAAAGGAVDPGDAAALRAALDDYCAVAEDVSRRLIAGETGEGVVASAAAMQARHLRLVDAIRKAGAFDRQELADAFASVARTQARATAYQVWIGVALVASVLGVSLALSRGVLRSLSGLTNGLARFGDGDFSRAIVVHGDDELADLARHANHMAESLGALGQARDRAVAALKNANRDLESFSYSVAHDLRAPLRGINGFSRALIEDFGDELADDAKDYLNRIAAGAHRMGELIDTLLALARLTRADLKRENVDLAAIAGTVMKQLRSAQPERVVEFVAPGDMPAFGDALQLRVLLENLLGNAWKFTSKRDAARIVLGTEARDGEVVHFVSDNGAGFDMAYAARLFAPFQRLHKGDEFPGTGIGLATVQRIVQRHGGRIWAEARVGHGATFFFTLSDRQGTALP